MRKYLSVALAIVALGSMGSAPALAQTMYRPAPRSSQQLYLYAPGYAPGAMGSPVAPASPNFTPYPNGEQITGSQANRSEWDPSYVPGAPD
jgi:hypothetical protein